MVDLAIPVAAGLCVVLIRGVKRRLEGKRDLLEEIQANAFQDIPAGALIAIGISALVHGLLSVELFQLDSSDLKIILAFSGFMFLLEGTKYVQRNILEPFRGRS